MGMTRLAFLVSGSGTNMENLVREVRAGRLKAEAALVLADHRDAGALARASRQKVPAAVVERSLFDSRQAFEAEISRILESEKIDLIVLAGFMRILSPDFVNRWWGRIVNIHPSLLPEFPGAHGIRDAFEAGVKETGVTVHFVDTGVDSGPIILQDRVAIAPADTLETLETKIHQTEYRLYPEALRLVIEGKSKMPAKTSA